MKLSTVLVLLSACLAGCGSNDSATPGAPKDGGDSSPDATLASASDAGEENSSDGSFGQMNMSDDGSQGDQDDQDGSSGGDDKGDGGSGLRHVGAAGIVCLLPDDSVEQPNTSLSSSGCWTDPRVAGISVGTHWDKIQPNGPTSAGGDAGAIDWTFFDTALALAKTNHKFIGIGVAAGVTSPAWIYDAGAPRVTANQSSGAETESEPWNATYQGYWRAIVDAMAARYDHEPNVAYVYIGGPGREFETYYLSESGDITSFSAIDSSATCGDAGAAATGTICDWERGAGQIVDMYGAAFSATPFLLVVANPFGGTSDSSQLANGQNALSALVNYAIAAYPGRAGIRSDGLRPGYGTQYAGSETSLLTTRTNVGFQMSLPSKNLGAVDGGALAASLDVGVGLGAHFVEVYQDDCVDASAQGVLTTYSAELLGNWNASVVSHP